MTTRHKFSRTFNGQNHIAALREKKSEINYYGLLSAQKPSLIRAAVVTLASKNLKKGGPAGLEELVLLDEERELPELEPLIDPAEAVSVTRSSLDPSSRLSIRSVCAPPPDC